MATVSRYSTLGSMHMDTLVDNASHPLKYGLTTYMDAKHLSRCAHPARSRVNPLPGFDLDSQHTLSIKILMNKHPWRDFSDMLSSSER